MLYQQVLADLFEAEIIAAHDADEIDETQESPALLAREAATPLLEQHDDVPLFVFETDHGFLVGGGSHGILMVPDGSVDVREIPEPDGEPADEAHGGPHQGRAGGDKASLHAILKRHGLYAMTSAMREADEELVEAYSNGRGSAEMMLKGQNDGYMKMMSGGEKGALMHILKRHGLSGAMREMAEAAMELEAADEDLNIRHGEVQTDEEFEYTLEMVKEHIVGYVDEHYDGEVNQELLNLLRAFDEAKDEEDYDRAIAAMEAVAAFVGTPLDEAGYYGSGPMPKKPMDTGPGYEGRSVSAGPAPNVGPGTKYGKGNQGGQMKLSKFMGSLYGAKNSGDGKEAGPAPKKPKDVGGAYAKFEAVSESTETPAEDEAYGGPYDGPQQPQLAHPKNRKPKNRKPKEGEEPADEPAMFEFTFPQSRVKEFLALAGKAGAESDGQVTVEGDNISVIVPEAVAKQVRVQFAGDDVTVEQVETAAAAD